MSAITLRLLARNVGVSKIKSVDCYLISSLRSEVTLTAGAASNFLVNWNR